ncbi:ribosome maturation factor RimM [Brachybacterium hainanense]|uniref:Ribosome maturation factor RimM n=1 Tax=Brachybacterium hainanense TaxID=1541174 RepID=A0ABV6RF15_9MICO
MSTRDVVVATIGKAHGLRGEVALILRTDQPEVRLARGTVFETGTAQTPRPLTIVSTRTQAGRWYARFAEIEGRTAAEEARGTELVLAVDLAEEADEDPDAWYPEDLIGLAVRHVDGTELGTVADLEHYPAQDLLIVRTPAGGRVMLPFVEQLVPEIDLEAGVVLADPPGGLFDPENAESERS